MTLYVVTPSEGTEDGLGLLRLILPAGWSVDRLKLPDLAVKDTTYNGWTNYETWSVNLLISNEQGSQEHADELARDAWEGSAVLDDWEDPKNPHITREWRAACRLADALKEWVEETPENGGFTPDLGCSLAAQLLGAALSEVDWRELAEHYVSDVPKEQEETL